MIYLACPLGIHRENKCSHEKKLLPIQKIFLTRNELLYIGIQILIGFEQILKQKFKKNSNQEVK